MTEFHTITRQIQQLEVYLNNLISALIRGELPVNLKLITQIFDNTISVIPPILNLSEDRFIDIYNDIPQILTAYAIDVTLSENSYRGISNDITFNRLCHGNYWIIASTELIDKAWLVPNPLKDLSFDRMASLDASFDRDVVNKNFDDDSNFYTYLLVAPALVQILPIAGSLTWKLLERGKINNSQSHKPTTIATAIEEIYKQLDKNSDYQSGSKYHQDLLNKRLDRHNDYIDLLQKQMKSILAYFPEGNSTLPTKETSIDLEKDTPVDSIDLREDISPPEIEESTEVVSEQLTAHEAGTNLVTSEPPKPQQEIISDYYHKPKEFTTKYQVKIANITKDSIKSNWGSEEKNVILEETNRGNYWIFDFDDCSYLVPVEDKYINQHSYTTTSTIFAGHNYTPDYQKIQLIKPAIVSIDPNSNPQTWRLQQQGELAFL